MSVESIAINEYSCTEKQADVFEGIFLYGVQLLKKTIKICLMDLQTQTHSNKTNLEGATLSFNFSL